MRRGDSFGGVGARGERRGAGGVDELLHPFRFDLRSYTSRKEELILQAERGI